MHGQHGSHTKWHTVRSVMNAIASSRQHRRRRSPWTLRTRTPTIPPPTARTKRHAMPCVAMHATECDPTRRSHSRTRASHACRACARHKRTIALPRARARHERRGATKRRYRQTNGRGRAGSQAVTRWASTPENAPIRRRTYRTRTTHRTFPVGSRARLAPRAHGTTASGATGHERWIRRVVVNSTPRVVSSNRTTPVTHAPSSRDTRVQGTPVTARHTAHPTYERHTQRGAHMVTTQQSAPRAID